MRNFEFHVKKFVKMNGVMYLLVECKQKFTNFSFWARKFKLSSKLGFLEFLEFFVKYFVKMKGVLSCIA